MKTIIKNNATLLLAFFVTLSAPTHAEEHKYFKMPDGSQIRILKQSGTTHTYVKGAKQNKDGKMTIETGTFFIGSTLAQDTPKTCLLVKSILMGLETVSVGEATVQVPSIKINSDSVDCSLTAGAIISQK